ncbi:MAG: ATP-binding cassette domain-containing protein [Bacteroidales bacterium]|jgi:ABC-type lipoprotein export system ATPase subunit|nr:ATP-binding cassette domain-containing protein [Bacteroidales bacterium]
MNVEKITVSGGYGKDGSEEKVKEFSMSVGDIVSIVGPTGCGKTTLINDIELFANRNTPSGRRISINDEPVPEDFIFDPADHPIALISQHTNFLSDLPVEEFLTIHATVRGARDAESIITETLSFANELTGEAILKDIAMTELSGGQTRSLLIADAVVIGNSPIILLDEIENAGIHRTKALELLKKYKKIFVFVTHDPCIALMSDFRIVMKNGAMQHLIPTCQEEKNVVGKMKQIDDMMLNFRQVIRSGDELTESVFNDSFNVLTF